MKHAYYDNDKAWAVPRDKFTSDIVEWLTDQYGYQFPESSTMDQKFELAKDWPPSCKHGWEFYNQIGSGTFGNVYIACKDNCDYVAKVIINQQLDVKGFNKEVKIMKELFDRHPEMVPKIYDSYICKAPFYNIYYKRKNKFDVGIIIMERMDGTLKDLMDKNIPDIKLIIDNAFDLVRKLNGLGILHRDMSIANITYKYVDRKYHLKIIDFGLALEKDEISEFGPTNWISTSTPYSMNERPNYDIWCLKESIDLYYKKRSRTIK